MKRRKIIFPFLISLWFCPCITMDKPLPLKLLKKVDDLLGNDAQRLQDYVKEENKGHYSPKLGAAIQTLNDFFSHTNIYPIIFKYDPKVIHQAQLVSERLYDRGKLMDALYCHDFKQCEEILEENPDVKNAYRRNYDGRLLTPLSEVVMSDDLRAISFLVSRDGLCINPTKYSVVELAKSKKALELLRSRGCYERITERERPEIIGNILKFSSDIYKYERAHYLIKRFRYDASNFLPLHSIQECLEGLLYEAIKYKRGLHIIEFLLNHQADPFHKNRDGKLPIQAMIKSNDKEIFELFKKKNIVFIPFTVCNIIELLQKTREEMQFSLYLTSNKNNRYALANLLADLFIVIKRHNPTDIATEQKIILLPDGWCFNNASFQDLEKIGNKETIAYIDYYLTAIMRENFMRLNVLRESFIDKFKQKITQYPFILWYSSSNTFLAWHRFFQLNDANFFSLLSHGPDLNSCFLDQNTLLHEVIRNKQPVYMKFLAQENNMLLRKNEIGERAIDLIIQLNDSILLDAFLKACLQRYTATKTFISPNTYSAPSEYADYVYRKDVRRMLKDSKNPNIFVFYNARTGKKMPLLHWLVKKNIIDLCEILLKNGAQINKHDSKGKYPLEYAFEQYGTRNMIMLLLRYKAYIDPTAIHKCVDSTMREFLLKESKKYEVKRAGELQ